MLIFAHRGASGYQSENTLSAMQYALSLGITAVELDVHLVENQLMVFHDRWLDDKTNGSGLIAEQTLTKLSQITIDGEPIVSLWQLLANLSPRPTVNIELKGANTAQALIALYPRLITELGYHDEQLLISSFNHGYLRSIRQQLPQAYLAPLIEGEPLDLAASASALNAYSVHLDVNFITKAMVDDAHQRGAKVFVFTVDRPQDIAMLADMGVDGIFSNYPDKAAAIVNSLPRANP